MTDYIISIGRGQPVDSNYLGLHDWERFQGELTTVANSLGSVTFTTIGVSSSPQWGFETSLTIGLQSDVAPHHVAYRLSSLARHYGQDAIAMTVGSTWLIGQ